MMAQFFSARGSLPRRKKHWSHSKKGGEETNCISDQSRGLNGERHSCLRGTIPHSVAGLKALAQVRPWMSARYERTDRDFRRACARRGRFCEPKPEGQARTQQRFRMRTAGRGAATMGTSPRKTLHAAITGTGNNDSPAAAPAPTAAPKNSTRYPGPARNEAASRASMQT